MTCVQRRCRADQIIHWGTATMHDAVCPARCETGEGLLKGWGQVPKYHTHFRSFQTRGNLVGSNESLRAPEAMGMRPDGKKNLDSLATKSLIKAV